MTAVFNYFLERQFSSFLKIIIRICTNLLKTIKYQLKMAADFGKNPMKNTSKVFILGKEIG